MLRNYTSAGCGRGVLTLTGSVSLSHSEDGICSRSSSPLTQTSSCLLRPQNSRTQLVGGRGLEPPCLAASAPKADVSAISPPAHYLECWLIVAFPPCIFQSGRIRR